MKKLSQSVLLLTTNQLRKIGGLMIRYGKAADYTILPINVFPFIGEVNAGMIANTHIRSTYLDYKIGIGVISVAF